MPLFLVFAMNAQADELRVGIIDTQRILRESVPALNAGKRIDKEFASRKLEIEKMQKQSKDIQTALEKDGLKVEDHRIKERELSALNTNLQRVQREFREDLNLRTNEELATVMARADKAIRAFAEAEKYDLILQEAVYRNPKIDITDKILKNLSEEKLEKSEK
jgi:outer membrane protein